MVSTERAALQKCLLQPNQALLVVSCHLQLTSSASPFSKTGIHLAGKQFSGSEKSLLLFVQRRRKIQEAPTVTLEYENFFFEPNNSDLSRTSHSKS